jgi:CHAD domain-containing protein
MPYRLSRRQPIADAVRDAGAELLRRAGDRLSIDRPSGQEIHHTRVAVKRVRALLNLIADDEAATGALDQRLRDANQGLSLRRDAGVLFDSFRDLATRATPDAIADFTAARSRVKDLIWKSTRHFIPLETMARELAEARHLWTRLPLADCHWAAVAERVVRSHRQARKQCRKLSAEAPAEAFHKWRKRTKRLQYQIEFLQPIDPDRWNDLHDRLKELTERLGRHHDLEVLADRLIAELPATPSRRRILSALRARQAKLAGKCLRRGDDLFDDKPSHLRRCLEEGWTTWYKPRAATS